MAEIPHAGKYLGASRRPQQRVPASPRASVRARPTPARRPQARTAQPGRAQPRRARPSRAPLVIALGGAASLLLLVLLLLSR